MSFILDALKKSENERQRRTGPSLADVRTGAPERKYPSWLIPVIALLAVNLLVIAGVLLWPEGETQVAVVTPEKKAPPRPPVSRPRPAPPAPAPTVDPAPPSVEPAAAPRPAVRSLANESGAQAPSAEPRATGAPVSAPTTPRVSNQTKRTPGTVVDDTVPTLNELIVDGRINLPSLHVDIHVYSDKPRDRFVFVNNRKYREGDLLSEGPRVEEISTLGVILNHRGQRFLLPRD